MVRTHKDLEVWRKSVDFVTAIYKATDTFPSKENFGLTSQIRRAAVSIPSNIAEGATRRSQTEFKQFLYIALASGAELETQLIISSNLNYLKEEQCKVILDELYAILRMVQGLIKSISR